MKALRILSASLCIAALSTSAIADTTEDAAKKAVVTVSLQQTSVHVELQFISQQSGIKVYYHKPEKDEPTVSLELNKVSVANVFQEIATMANLTVKYDAGLVFFTANE